MAQKFPPPPQFTGPEFQLLNRWLIEVQSILSNEGGIDPAQVNGLTAFFAVVAANSAAIAALQISDANNAAAIGVINGEIIAINTSIATINGQITTLSARGELLFGVGAPAAGLGKVNDWYGDTAGAVGARVWIKKAVGTWVAFPF